jgi:hypothetical protein
VTLIASPLFATGGTAEQTRAASTLAEHSDNAIKRTDRVEQTLAIMTAALPRCVVDFSGADRSTCDAE